MEVIPNSKRCSSLSCHWDAGADISPITFSKARQLKLYGWPAKLHVTTASGQKSILDSPEYKLILRDKFQVTHGMEGFTESIKSQITSPPSAYCIHIRTEMHIHRYTHIHIYTYTHIHKYTNTHYTHTHYMHYRHYMHYTHTHRCRCRCGCGCR